MITKTLELTPNKIGETINNYEDDGWAVRTIVHVAPGKVLVVLERYKSTLPE